MTVFSRQIAFPADEPSRATGFAGGRLDRLSERRGDAALAARFLADPAARVLLFAGDRLVLGAGAADPPVALWPLWEADALGLDRAGLLFLGLDGSGPVFAGLLGAAAGEGDGRFETRDLRSLAQAGILPPDTLGAVAQGRSLTGWHARHGFCANCGARTVIACLGSRRDCPSCGAHHFPRVDPVVIMLAIAGDRALLGRQHRFRPGMYSCLAGFVEPGETMEDAVRRELTEEAGIGVGRVAYHASQPWPFPSSLMIGCFAEALTTDVVPEEEELEDARFFHRDELALMLADRHPDGLFVPPPMAIAHHIIRAFAAP